MPFFGGVTYGCHWSLAKAYKYINVGDFSEELDPSGYTCETPWWATWLL